MPWTRGQVGVLSGVILLTLALLAWRVSHQSFRVTDPRRETETPADIADRLDPNTADWPALALLPGMGEKKARTFIEQREDYRRRHPERLPFERPEDLLRMNGIGLPTMQSLAPWMRFPTTSPATNP